MREFHENARRFRNAVTYTASISGFGARQIESQLKPVLRNEDFEAFDLDRALSVVAELAERL